MQSKNVLSVALHLQRRQCLSIATKLSRNTILIAMAQLSCVLLEKCAILIHMLAVLAVLQSMMADRITAFGHVMAVMIYGTAQMIKYRRADAESKSISSFY